MTDNSPRGGRGERVYAPDFLTELFQNPLDQGYADAAQRRRVDPPSPARVRSGRVVSAVVLLALGFLFAVAYRQTVAEEPDRSQARSGLVSQIRERQEETDRLTRRAEQLREDVARQRDAALTRSAAARLRDLEAMTGLGRVRGDGVVVQLADASGNQDAVTGAGGPGPGRVLYRDLQLVANALWAAGAEAIAVNDQRLTSTSTIRSAGEAILVDFRPVTGPYRVSAIGPDGMRRRFEASTAAALLRRVADQTGLSFGSREAEDLTLPEAATDSQLRYASPPPPESPQPSPSSPAAGSSSVPRPSGSGTSSPSPSGGGR
ncbi:DUF881 domain-containing protein [Micromonospora inyonensis]|uniref:Uncharacterized conserved protein YlxW, UPF0749 family n=1 Tax=Micromonospora inyonensis TaxID=47866 RepID=A0A1C6SBQ4_9ACTN|nr:DUF881 domain-containing protein [Micromonospora inyonensis]SCL26837.1 Uncharacterized conserved protein YlxW, UPF0749 family [Micromonospora inyonensis]